MECLFLCAGIAISVVPGLVPFPETLSEDVL